MGIIRRIVCIAAAAALGFGLGWLLRPGETAVPAAAHVEENPIEAFRTEREQLRAMERAQLSEMIHDSAAEAEIRGMAQRRLLEINEAEAAENTLEGILSLRGWGECVATVGSDSVNILIPAEIITQQESRVILELACRETGVQSGNVKIIPINSAK